MLKEIVQLHQMSDMPNASAMISILMSDSNLIVSKILVATDTENY
ncbi:MAG: hypothetical protein OEL84_07265 [Nitrosopumilus sp.]|nr:hypothetical protein [Nitrosopumilus sp.]